MWTLSSTLIHVYIYILRGFRWMDFSTHLIIFNQQRIALFSFDHQKLIESQFCLEWNGSRESDCSIQWPLRCILYKDTSCSHSVQLAGSECDLLCIVGEIWMGQPGYVWSWGQVYKRYSQSQILKSHRKARVSQMLVCIKVLRTLKLTNCWCPLAKMSWNLWPMPAGCNRKTSAV